MRDSDDGDDTPCTGQMRRLSIAELKDMALSPETVRQRGKVDVADSRTRAGCAIGTLLLDSYAKI